MRRLLLKGVPLHAAIPFMLTAPIINPIVLFSTYIAFGNQIDMVLYRSGLALVVAFLVGYNLIVPIQRKSTIGKGNEEYSSPPPSSFYKTNV